MTIMTREQQRIIAHEMDANDDLDGAMAAYQSLLAQDPTDSETGYDLVQLHLEQSRPDLAIELCRKNGGATRDYRMAAALSGALQALTRFSEAEYYANLALTLAPLAVESLCAKLHCFRIGGRTADMQKLLTTALEAHPNDTRLLTLAAQSYSVLGGTQQQSLRLAHRVLALAPRARVLRITLLDTFGSLITGRPVVEDLRHLVRRNPDNYRVHLALAYEDVLKDRSSALEHLARAELLAPTAFILLYARAHFAALAGEKEACLGFIRAMEAFDQEPYELMRSQAYLLLALAQYDEALRKTQNLIAFDPTRWEGRSLETHILRDMGEREQCLDAHNRMLADFPGSDGVRLEAAEIFAWEKKIEEAEKALQECTEELDADAARGIIAFNKDDFENAVRHFERVLPTRSDMLDWLICAYGKMHRFADIEVLLAKENIDPALKMRYIDILIAERADSAKALRLLQELDSAAGIDWARAASAATQLDNLVLAQEFAEREAALHPDDIEPLTALADIIAWQGKNEEATTAYRRAHALNGAHVAAMAALGGHLAATQEIQEAITLYRSAVAIANIPAHRVMLAWLLANKGEFGEAAALLASLTAEDSFDTTYAGEIAMRSGRNDLAELFLDRALQEGTVSAETHHYKARILTLQGKKEAAEEHYQKAIALAPGDYILSHNHALLLEEVGRVREALRVFKGLTELPALEHDALTHINLARLQLRCGDLAMALDTARSAMDFDCTAENLLLFGQLLNEAGYCAEALAYLDDTLRMFPEATALIVERASVLGHLGRWQEACDFLVGLEPKHGHDAAFKKMLGRAWLAVESPAKGIQCLQESERLGGDDAGFACSLGRELLKRGDRKGAGEAYRRAIALSKDSASLVTGKWLTAYDECGLHEEGLALSREVSESGPMVSQRAMEGVFLLRLGRHAEAEVVLEEASKDTDWLNDDYALCLLELGRPTEALRVILPVVARCPFHLQVLRAYLRILVAVDDKVAAEEVRIILQRKERN